MSLKSFEFNGSFDADEVKVLSDALDEAWDQVRHHTSACQTEMHSKSRLAQVMLRCAQVGPFDKDELVSHTLSTYKQSAAELA